MTETKKTTGASKKSAASGTTSKAAATRKTAPAKKAAAPKKSAAATKTKAGQQVNIDGKNYNLDTLSDVAKAQLNNLRATDRLISELELELSVAKTARSSYSETLERELSAMNTTLQ